MEKIDLSISKLRFQIYAILRPPLRTHFETLGRQLVCQSPNNTSDSKHSSFLHNVNYLKKYERQSDVER